MKKTKHITRAAIIAALYVALTYVAFTFGIASGPVQVRFSECLTILPFFTYDAIIGLFVGCILSNLLTGCVLLDIIFGSLATLIGAFGTFFIAKLPLKNSKKFLAAVPPIVANTVIIPFVLKFAYVDIEDSIPALMITIGLGEVIAAGILGTLLLFALSKHKKIFE